MKKKTFLIILVASASLFSVAQQSRRTLPKQGLAHKTSFTENWERYPSPDMILDIFKRAFPLKSYANIEPIKNCISLTDSNRSTLGDNNVQIGEPLIKDPNLAFSHWYASCLAIFLNQEREQLTPSMPYRISQENQDYLGKEIVDFCISTVTEGHPDGGNIIPHCLWKKIPLKIKQKKISLLVDELIGPTDVIADLGIANSTAELVEIVIQEIDKYSESPDDRYAFLQIDGNGLNVFQAVQIAKFLVLLTDGLRF